MRPNLVRFLSAAALFITVKLFHRSSKRDEHMGKLAISGGDPLRKAPFTTWPMSTKEELLALEDVLASSKWGGQPFPGKYALAFAKKFAEFHTAKYAQCVNTG